MPTDPRSILLRAIGERCRSAGLRVAALRGDGSMPEIAAEDIDLLVHPGDASRLSALARAAATELGWRPLFEERMGNHRHLVCCHPDAIGQRTGAIHLDVQDALGRKGLRYALAEPFLAETAPGSWLPRLLPAPHSVALALHTLLDKACVREDYRTAICVADRSEVERFSLEVLPPRAADRLSAWIRAGAPAGDVPRVASAVRSEIVRAHPANLVRPVGVRLRRWMRLLGPRRGILVAFLGPDGAGKSTLVEAVAQLIPAGPFPVRTVYMGKRETFLPTSRLIRAIYARRGQGVARGPARSSSRGAGRFLSRAKDIGGLVNWWCEQWARYLVQVRPVLQQGGVVLTDRYAFDVANRDGRSLAHTSLFRKLLPRLFPVPDRTFLLWERPEVLHHRKPELTIEEASTLLDRLRLILRAVPGSRELETDRPAATVATEIALDVTALLGKRCR